jgi:ferrochelatase
VNKQKLNPDIAHAKPSRIGVLVANLGTPDAPTAKAVRPYLKQFLSDPRVVEVPRIIWWVILNLIILPIRAGASAKKYASVWYDGPTGGAPLLVHSRHQTDLLRTALNQENEGSVMVEMAMRYGNPSTESVLQKMDDAGVDRILILPLYPQYSATTSASTFDEIYRIYKSYRNPPAIRTIKHYHDHHLYIQALRSQVEDFWAIHGKPDFAAGDKLVMSFHGVPKRTLDLGDPYHCECRKTGRLLRESLGLSSEQAILSFQSRFGKAEWLKPYTAPLLEKLGSAKTPRLDIFCPGFPADCLETLEEIAMEGKEIFQHAGGGVFHAIPCLNDHPQWILALHGIAEENLLGWSRTFLSIDEVTQRKQHVSDVVAELKKA